ncbi:hypothetical protein [Amycolatopsis sp. NPDC051716]|uniref:hypothetical protein n=1 Tax=Amycolatopsis sp. NPDC051716 TaxID=3155804 RepID=UPI00341A07DC
MAIAVLADPVIAIPATGYGLLKFLIIPLFGRLVTRAAATGPGDEPSRVVGNR